MKLSTKDDYAVVVHFSDGKECEIDSKELITLAGIKAALRDTGKKESWLDILVPAIKKKYRRKRVA